MTFVLSPFIETSLVGKSFEAKQASMKEFFRRNPTPARVEINGNDEGIEVQIPVRGISENTGSPAAPAPVNPPSRILRPAHRNNRKSAGSPAIIQNYCRI
jgi:hypothetical protein